MRPNPQSAPEHDDHTPPGAATSRPRQGWDLRVLPDGPERPPDTGIELVPLDEDDAGGAPPADHPGDRAERMTIDLTGREAGAGALPPGALPPGTVPLGLLADQPPSVRPAALDPARARALLLSRRADDWAARLPAPSPDDESGVSPRALAIMAYRVAYRLTGSAERSAAIALAALDAPERRRGPSPESAVVRSVLGEVVADHGTTDLTFYDGDDVYRAHRLRLRRDLGRWSRDDQVVMALRHLVGRTVPQVCALVDRSERSVRHVTSAWAPADGLGSRDDLLTGIEQWAPDLAEPTSTLGLTDHLGHLDDPETPLDLGGSAV